MRVAVLGLGKMGGSMARRLVDTKTDVIGWNRSQPKIDAFVADGGCGEAGLREAAGKADVLIMVLGTMGDTVKLLEQVGGLENKVVVNLCSGNPDEGREVAEVVEKLHGGYVDGAYSGAPSKARAGAGTVFVSCEDEKVKENVEPVLKNLGEVVWAGKIGASRALDYAVVDLAMANFMSYASNKSMMETEDVDPELYFRCAAQRLATIEATFRHLRPNLDSRTYTEPIATLDTWTNFTGSRLPYMEKRGIPTVMPDITLDLLNRASENGARGEEDFTRLQEVLTYKPKTEE